MSKSRKRWLACVDCGVPVFKRPRYDRIIRCHDCAALQMRRVALEMANKCGPAWDAWLASNADGAPGRGADTPEE